MRYNARLDCLITLHQKLSVYVKDKAAKGGAKHPLHTLETSVLSKLHMARPNGRFCGAKRPKCEAEQPLGFD